MPGVQKQHMPLPLETPVYHVAMSNVHTVQANYMVFMLGTSYSQDNVMNC